MPLRVGIVGAGLMGRWHGHAAGRAGARVTAVIDSNAARAEALSARHRGSRAFAELRAALDLVDVVHVCTPTVSHVPLAAEALRAGRHVLVEKPLASTFEETETLIAAAAANAVLICPVHQFLFQDGTRKALSTLDEIGPLRHIDITVCSAGAEGLDASARDLTALEVLPHPLSLLVRLVPEAVDQLEWSVRHPGPGELRAVAELGAVTVDILISMSGRPTLNQMRMVGSGGSAHVDFFHGFAAVQRGGVSRYRKLTQPFTYAASSAGAALGNLALRTFRWEPAYPGLRTLVAEFYRALHDKGSCPIPPREIIAVARAYDELVEILAGPRQAEARRHRPHERAALDRG